MRPSLDLGVSTALSEIVVRTIAPLILVTAIKSTVLGADGSWINFLSDIGAIVLALLPGAELDPQMF
jgi:Kef-type K+ transport system membrane component KefB